MMDLIDRQQALKEIHDRHEKAVEWFLGTTNSDEIKARAEAALAAFTECYLTIQRLPSAEKTGKWIKENVVLTSDPPQYVLRCSECGKYVHGFYAHILTNYCPACGAKMEGETNE